VSDVAYECGDVEANYFDRVRDNLKRDGLTEEREEGKRYLVEAKATGVNTKGARLGVTRSAPRPCRDGFRQPSYRQAHRSRRTDERALTSPFGTSRAGT
jgi:hypothetical protein